MNKQLHELINQEVSRKDFLRFIGGGLVVAFGVQSFVSYLLQFNQRSAAPIIDTSSHGFGSRKFGA